MKATLHSRILIVTISLVTSFFYTSAQELPFSQVPENTFTFKGNLQMIGNHVVSIDQYLERDRFGNLVDIRFAPNDDFNEALTNAFILMNYVDIDGANNDTVSSSSADLTLPSECSEIRYAGLYWAGTYFWNTPAFVGTFRTNGGVPFDALTGTDTGRPAYIDEATGLWTETVTSIRATYTDRGYGNNDASIPNPRTQDDANDFRYIKFAPPGQPYIDITPTSAVPSEVLFDGFAFSYPPPPGGNNNTSITDVPYVAYADVTSILQGLENPSGTYTVGNVKCYTGSGDGGGTAGGWTLVVTYEDPNEPTRFISSFEGYALIRNGQDPIEYSYSGFQTIPNGPVRADFGVVTLEGDEGFTGDALAISTPTNPAFTPLFSGVNPATNFFNGSISVDGNFVTTRNPASENTLGYDQDIFQVENPNNSVIANDETSATFRTSTNGDTFATFLNTFAIEVIRPDIRIVKRVEDVDGNEIPQGGGVLLGQELFYELTIQNIGNDDAINTIIRDNIPVNTDFLAGTIELPPTGVTSSYDATNRQLVFDVDNSLVQIGAAPFVIRFKVQVATRCEELRDACSSEINNTAEASYEGRESGIVVPGDASVVTVDDCDNEGATFSNFIVDLGTCTFDFETFLCNGEAVLTAGNDYDTYTWRNSAGIAIGNTQTIRVDAIGDYTVEGVSNDCRDNTETHRVVPLTVSNQNPIFTLVPPVINSIAFCPIDNSRTPEIYICGSEQVPLDLSNFANASTIEWERLDASSCAANPIVGCVNTDSSCNWVTVGTNPTFTINEPNQTFPAEGEYRISVVYANTCVEFFYFNVYQNTLDPDLQKRDIICGEPGFVRVENVPVGDYEFSLDNVTYQASNEFTGITTPGEVTVYIRQVFIGTPICTFEERITIFDIDTEANVTTTDPTCPAGNGDASTGSISIQLSAPGNNVAGTYSYTVTDVPYGGSFTSTQTPDATSIIFDGLNPATYDITATSFSGVCRDLDTVTINEPPVFEVIASREENLSCERAEILLDVTRTTTGALILSLDNFATTLQPGDAANLPDIGSPPANYFLLNGDGTISVFVNTAGTYIISIEDNETNCRINSNPVVIDPYTPIVFSTVENAPDCAGDSNGSIQMTITPPLAQGPYEYVLYDRSVTTPAPTPTNPNPVPEDVLTERATNNTNDVTFTFAGLPAGEYSVGIRDFFGCEFPVPIDLIDPDGLTATATATDYTCDNELTTQASITFVASGGTPPYEYSIDGVTFVTNSTIQNITDGTYSALTVRDDNDCTFIITPAITIEPLQRVTGLDFVPSAVACNGTPNTIDVTVTPTLQNGPLQAGETVSYIITPAVSGVTNPSTATTYTLEQGITYTFEAVTSKDNCSQTFTYTTPQVTPASVTTQLINNVRCRGEANGSFSFTVIDAANFTYTVTGGPTTVQNGSGSGTTAITIDNLLAGTYTVAIMDAVTGCTDDAPITILEPNQALDFTVQVGRPNTCTNGANINVRATGGWGGYEYQLENGTGTILEAYQGNSTFNDLADGNYVIRVRDLNGCIVSQPYGVDPVLIPVINLRDQQLCFTPSGPPVSVDIEITDGSPPFTYILNGGLPVNTGGNRNITITGLVQGVNEIVIIDGKQCSSTVTPPFEVTIAPQLVVSANLTKDLDCSASEDATIVVTPQDGYPNATAPFYTITFENQTTGATGAVTTNPFTTNIPGTYVFTATDSADCTAMSNPVVVSERILPVAVANPVNPSCNGSSDGSVTITVNQGTGTPDFEYSFNGGAFGAVSVFSGLSAGNYSYQVRDDKECIFNGMVTLTNPDPIVQDSVVIDDIECSLTGGNVPGQIALTIGNGVAPFDYTLITPSGAVATTGTETSSPNPVIDDPSRTITFSGLNFGSYTIRVVDDNGCSQDFTYPVASSPEFNFSTNPFVDCVDGITANIEVDPLTGGVGPFEIRLFNGQAPGDLTGFIPLNGLPAPPVTNTSGNILNHEISSTSPLGPLLFGITYVIEVRNTDTGCSEFRQLGPIDNPFTFDVTADPSNVVCNGESTGSVEFTVTGLSGTGLSWEVLDSGGQPIPAPLGPIVGNDPTATGPTYTNTTDIVGILPQGVYNLRVTENVVNPCTDAVRFVIDEPNPLSLDQVGNTIQPVCDRDGLITVRGIGGTTTPTSGYTFIALPSGDPIPVDTDPFINGPTLSLDPTADTDWDIYVKDANDCIEGPITRSITPYVEPLISAAVVDECDVQSDGTLAVEVRITNAGAVSGTTFQFSRDGVSFEPIPATTTTTYTFNVLPGNGQIFYVRDENSCDGQSAPIDVFPEIQFSATWSAPTCTEDDGTVAVTSSGGSGVANHSYVLLDNGGAILAGPVTPGTGTFTFDTTNIPPGNGISIDTYSVRVTDSGISDSASVNCFKELSETFTTPVAPELSLVKTDASCTTGSNPTGADRDEDGTITASLINGSDSDPGITGYLYEIFSGDLAANPIPVGPYTPGAAATTNPFFDEVTPGTSLSPGTYTIRVTSGSGCTDQEEITIDPPQDLTVAATLTTDFACAADNSTTQAQITATVDATNFGTPGTAPGLYSFSIDNDQDAIDTSDNFFAANGTPNGAGIIDTYVFDISPITVTTIYTITVKDANGCEATNTVSVDPLNKPTATAVFDTTAANSGEISCNNPGVVIVTAQDGSGDYTIEAVDGAAPTTQSPAPIGGTGPVTATFTVDEPGRTYNFRVIDDVTGCFTNTNIITAPLGNLSASLVGSNACPGTAGTLELTYGGLGAGEDFTYTINPADGSPATTSAVLNTGTDPSPLTIPGLVAGNYTVTLSRTIAPATTTLTTQCSVETGIATVVIPDAIDVDATQVQDLGCDPTNNASIQTSVTGGFGGYEYQLEETSNRGTAVTNSDPVTPVTYSFGNTSFFTDLPQGDYVVVVRDQESCLAESLPVSIVPPPTMNTPTAADMTVNCFMDVDGSVTVIASGGQGVDTYIFIIERPNGQTESIPPNGTDRATFTGLVPDNTNPYTATVTDNLGCAASTTFFIREPDEVIVTVATDNNLSCLTPERVTVSAIGGTGPYEYGISTDGGVTITYGTVDTFDIYEDAALGTYGPGNYTFYARDTNMCESGPSNQVTIVAIPDLAMTPIDDSEVLCAGELFTSVSTVASGGQGGYEYTLTNTSAMPNIVRTGGMTDDDANNYRFPGTFLNLEEGTYTFEVTSGDCGIVSDTFTITAPPPLAIVVTEFDVTCNDPLDTPDDKDGRIVIEASGGRGEFLYTLEDLTRPTGTAESETLPFQNAGDANTNPETFEFTMLQPGTYRVTVQDRNGCFEFEDNIIIGEPDVLTATPVVVTQVDCADQNNAEIEVTITGGTQPYTISENGGPFVPVPLPPDPVNDPHIFVSSGLSGGTIYNYDVRDSRDCPVTNFVITQVGLSVNASLVCEVNDMGTADPADDIVMGYGIQASIPQDVIEQRPDLLVNLEYILDLGTADERVIPRATFESPTNRNTFSNVGPGAHTVAVRNSVCTFTVMPDITVPELLQITAVVPTGVLNEWQVVVDGGVPFDTSTGDEPYRIYVDGVLIEGNTFVIDVTRVYNFSVEDSLTTINSGLCPATTSIELEFVDLFIPNYFTPNGDGTYDTWYPENTEFFPDIKVKVFDRYGRLLQQFKGPVKGWDGRYQDKLLPSGDYWYLIELNHDGRERQFTGHFTLYR